MGASSARTRGGAHRKQRNSTIGRVAMVTATTAAVTAASFSIATAETTPTRSKASAEQRKQEPGTTTPTRATSSKSTTTVTVAPKATATNQSAQPTMSRTATPMAKTTTAHQQLTTHSPVDEAQPEPSTVKVIKHNDATNDGTAPTVVAVQDFRPVVNLSSQLMTALQYNHERIMRDLADRAPEIVLPAEGTLTSGFGARWGAMHNGVDIANVTNTPILSVMDGTVIDAGPAQGFGQWVRVQHDNGLVTVYGHIESIYVTVGERVVAGQTIAGMGNRGFSTGTHLHFEVHPDGVTPVDPLVWLAEHGLYLF